jgi:hypothetical protein
MKTQELKEPKDLFLDDPEEVFNEYADVWDYVSMSAISDGWWNDNIDFIKELTISLFRLDCIDDDINLQRTGKRLEIIFSTLKSYGFLK